MVYIHNCANFHLNTNRVLNFFSIKPLCNIFRSNSRYFIVFIAIVKIIIFYIIFSYRNYICSHGRMSFILVSHAVYFCKHINKLCLKVYPRSLWELLPVERKAWASGAKGWLLFTVYSLGPFDLLFQWKIRIYIISILVYIQVHS